MKQSNMNPKDVMSAFNSGKGLPSEKSAMKEDTPDATMKPKKKKSPMSSAGDKLREKYK